MAHVGRRLDRGAAVAATEALSIDRLVAALDEVDVEEVLSEVVGLMQRCGRLFFRTYNPKREGARDSFLDCVEAYIMDRAGHDAATHITRLRELVRQVEAGYRDVAHGVAGSAISALPAGRRYAAVLQRVGRDGDFLRDRADAALAAATVFTSEVIATDEAGREFDADGALSAYVGHLGSFLRLWSDEHGASGAGDRFVFPVPTPASEEEVFQAGTSIASAGAYRRWRRTEERRRFWGGELLEHRPPNLPPGTAATFEVVREYRPGPAELLDVVANERLRDMLLRQATIAFSVHVDQASGPGPLALAPSAYVSASERGSLEFLASLLAPGRAVLARRFQGLTLPEWTRGYAVLSIVARQAYGQEPTIGARSLRVLGIGELEERLGFLGLSNAAIATFVGHATFGPGEADLFDRPLLLLEDGRRLLYAPAAADVEIARTVLSNLGALRDPLDGKGSAFNGMVIEFLEGLGFAPFRLDTERNGDKYEIDVLLPWGDHLFLFECKNEMLSEGSPVSAYNFEVSRRRHVAQARRQADGVARHPDMILEAAGFDPSGMHVVTSLLYALPFSSPDLGEGVHVTDWSSLTRFFRSRDVVVAPVIPLVPGVDPPVPETHRLWDGEAPTPSDLVRQLSDPIQVALSVRRMVLEPEPFWLSDHRGALSQSWRREPL